MRTTPTYSIQRAQIIDGMVAFDLPAGSYERGRAMREAKKAAGRGARYIGDGLSIRYSGACGTVYVISEGRA